VKINTDKEVLVNSGGENASSEKIFDDDSTNITNLNKVQYIAKFSAIYQEQHSLCPTF
jgi:ribonucleotide reductase beta subunit family protein with ferritin-like domain